MSKKLRKKEENFIKQQYKNILSHSGVGVNDKFAGKYFKRNIIAGIVVFIIMMLFWIFSNTKMVYNITNGKKQLYYAITIYLTYLFAIQFSNLLYNAISFFYEKRNKHELLKKDIKGFLKIFYYLFIAINFPWVGLGYIFMLVTKWLKIEILREYMTILAAAYSYSLFISLLLLLFLCQITNSLMINGIIRLNIIISQKTILYFLVLISVWACKKLQEGFIKLFLFLDDKSARYKYNNILIKNNLLLFYILILITFIFKALEFSGVYKDLVDALFYSTNMVTMVSTAVQKANS